MNNISVLLSKIDKLGLETSSSSMGNKVIQNGSSSHMIKLGEDGDDKLSNSDIRMLKEATSSSSSSSSSSLSSSLSSSPSKSTSLVAAPTTQPVIPLTRNSDLLNYDNSVVFDFGAVNTTTATTQSTRSKIGIKDIF